MSAAFGEVLEGRGADPSFIVIGGDLRWRATDGRGPYRGCRPTGYPGLGFAFQCGGADGLIDRKAPGQRAKLNDEQRRALARIVEQGPIPAVHGVVRWRRKDLALWIFEEFGISLEESSVGRELRAMGFCKIAARPRHKGQNEYALDDFKKNSQPRWGRSGQRSRPART